MTREEVLALTDAASTAAKQDLTQLELLEAAIHVVRTDWDAHASETQRIYTLGSLIAQYNEIERRLRSSVAALVNRYGYPKREFRSMLVGYYVDEDGFATDPQGDRLGESLPGEFYDDLEKSYYLNDASDEINICDSTGATVCTIHKCDVPAVKEILGHFDVPARDGINLLYSKLAEDENHLLHRYRKMIMQAMKSGK